jgi:hypothetical protein
VSVEACTIAFSKPRKGDQLARTSCCGHARVSSSIVVLFYNFISFSVLFFQERQQPYHRSTETIGRKNQTKHQSFDRQGRARLLSRGEARSFNPYRSRDENNFPKSQILHSQFEFVYKLKLFWCQEVDILVSFSFFLVAVFVCFPC